MNKKQKKIQLVLILFGLFLIFATYFYYPYTKQIKLTENEPAQDDLGAIQKEKDSESTSFKNVEYKGFYDLTKPFIIKSEEAYMLNEEPNVIYMSKMHVILYLSDERIVHIKSDEGSYNKITYDCYFQKNVVADDGETQILAKNLDLLATENTAKIWGNVNLNYPTGSLKADNIDYNFETKYFKVSMFDDETIKMKVIK